jgi:hypothetical protein
MIIPMTGSTSAIAKMLETLRIVEGLRGRERGSRDPIAEDGLFSFTQVDLRQ